MDMKVARGGDSKAGELPKGPAAGVPPTTNPIDIALETGRHDPDLESPARRVLQKNERLIEAQTAQLGRQRWRDFIITALGVCVLAGACLLVWDASQAKGVVVEPFAAPPDLVERGLSGPVLAAQMLDKLSRMQAQTESTRAASTYANDWGGDIEIEIPNTGVSIGEVRRYLRAWLGDQTRLSGEVFRLTDGRLAVTTRVGTNPATRGEGAEANLDALLQQGAEAIYAETQPFRYAVWLVQQNRNDEAKAVFQALVAGSDKDERLWGYYGLSNLAETSAERHRNLQAALRLNPRFTPAMFNLAMSLGADGREEQGYTTLGDFVAHAADARRELQSGWAEDMLNQAHLIRAGIVGDTRQASQRAEKGIGLSPWSQGTASAPVAAAVAYAAAHDLPAARRVLQEHGLLAPEAMAKLQMQFGPEFEYQSQFAMSVGDWAAARDHVARVLAASSAFQRGPAQADLSAGNRAVLAAAHARLGQIDEARAAIIPTKLDCAPCVRARGLVEAYAGNGRAADHWLRESVRIAPSLPTAHADWAEAYLVRRDPARAILQARLAVEKGPNWAEPRKFWGDALMMQNKPSEAARKYREAVRLAPNWGALHLALGRAQAAGQTEAARGSFSAASRMDLSPADRTAVTSLLN